MVWSNLKSSFPEKSDEELKQVEKKFYRFLCDVFLETLKTKTMSHQELFKRACVTPETRAVFERLRAEGRPVIVFTAHLGHWEWAGAGFDLNYSP